MKTYRKYNPLFQSNASGLMLAQPAEHTAQTMPIYSEGVA